MFLIDVLSQLAILGATSIALSNGCIVPFDEAAHLLAKVAPFARFALRAYQSYVEVVDDNGELFARALTLWRADDRRGLEQIAVQSVATSLQAGGTPRS
jgi:hypothetical protein